ncbi:MAG: SEC-C metal-binding domain-containing protein [Polyangiaceae bacterium]|jgi:hypothetical protein
MGLDVDLAPQIRVKVGRNKPCPCGSGKKYKKCCLASDEAARPRATDGRGDRRFEGHKVPREQADLAAQHFPDTVVGRAQASRMTEYAKPLIDATDGSIEETRAALHFAMIFWNLALTADGAERTAALSKLALDVDRAERSEFEGTARMMFERHRTMFPEMHRAK